MAQRSEVLWFAEMMERKLKANDHKGGWSGENEFALLVKLEEELDELKYELRRLIRDGSLDVENAAIFEAADVANYAMMIADVIRKRSKRGNKEEAPGNQRLQGPA